MYPDSEPKLQDESVNGLFRVCDVDWSNSRISRAGIIPIYTDGVRKWIGLGVTNFATNLTTIGGRFEITDDDLLSTAVREYNEEVRPNMLVLTEESVYNCYTIKTDCDLNILLPIDRRPSNFVKTSELYTMVWVTTRQLGCLVTDKMFYKSRARVLSLSWGLRELIPVLARVVDSGIPFTRVTNIPIFKRPKKVTGATIVGIFTNIKEFENDALVPDNFRGHTGLIVSETNIALFCRDGKVYLLPFTDGPALANIINRIGVKVYTSTIADENLVTDRCGNIKTITSIERSFNRNHQEFKNIFRRFMAELSSVRNQDVETRAIAELYLIYNYEEKFYELLEKINGFFSERRAKFLIATNNVNLLLSKGPIEYSRLKRILVDGAGYDTNESEGILKIMINTNLVVQTSKTAPITI